MKKKVVGTIFMVVGSIVLTVLATIPLQKAITAPSNHGVGFAFGVSCLRVESNSMEGDKEDSFAVGSGIVIVKKEARDLRIGQVVTFYDRNISAINTHRIVDIEETEDGLRFHTKGDNIPFYETDNYEGEHFYAEDYIGSLLFSNSALGNVIGFKNKMIDSDWFVPVLAALAIGAITVVIFISIYEKGKKKEVQQNEK